MEILTKEDYINRNKQLFYCDLKKGCEYVIVKLIYKMLYVD